jgi:hypothetical protein
VYHCNGVNSASAGDAVVLPYEPQVVVISETRTQQSGSHLSRSASRSKGSVRLVGITAWSLFMDVDDYREFSRFGVNADKSGNDLTSTPPKAVKKLEAGEKDLYSALCSPGWDGPRRVEQERIPIERAATTVRSLAVVLT